MSWLRILTPCVPVALLFISGASRTLLASTSSLEESFALESRLLDAAVERYRTARDDERRVIARYEAHSEKAESELIEFLGVSTLWEHERRLGEARARLLEISSEVGHHRRSVYARLERLSELGAAIERHRHRQLVETERIGGRWRLEIEASDELGLMDLDLDGTLVTGAYRLSSGAQGSLRGTYANHRLDLERVDTVQGIDMRLVGIHDPESGEILGTWESIGPTDVSGQAGSRDALSGVPVPDPGSVLEGALPVLRGQWTAQKISPAEADETTTPSE